MDNPVILYVIGGAFVLFFIFLLVMCWKTWRWMHVVFSFLTFAGSVTFLIFASAVLKTNHAWRTLYEAYSKENARLEVENEHYLHGNLLEVAQSEASIRSLYAEKELVQTARGRVWRECTPLAAVDADTFRVRTVPASLPQNANAEPNGIRPKDVLYVFAETESSDGWKVPATYLGEFVVDSATPTELSISATLPLDDDQRQRIAQGRATWTLYEIMPLDGHEVLAEWDANQRMLVGLDKQELAKFIPNQFNWPDAQYQQFLEPYYRFNREATEDDPPENTWVLVKFSKPHGIQVDSDAEQSLLQGEGRYFDSSGRAIEARVKRGEDGTVQFKAGDTAVFDQETAGTMIADGVCQKVRPVYRRSLHDYQRFFRETFHRHNELDESIARVNREVQMWTETKAKADAQIAFRSGEKVNLEKDLAEFRRELTQATGYAQALDAQWRKSMQELSLLYRTNVQLADQLKAIQYQMAQEINRRALEATAQATPPTTAPR